MTKRIQRGALVAALAAIALVCLPPGRGPALAAELDFCLVCGQNGAASALLNIALYVPLGAALWWWRRDLTCVVALGALVSVAVESLQLVIPGRHTALSDLVANTLGAALGGVLALRPLAWMAPEGRGARVATAVAATAGCVMLLLTGFLFRPSAPPGDYYGQWTPSGPYSPTYDGEVLKAQLGDLALPSRHVGDSEGARAAIRDRAPVALRFVAGSPTATLTAVLRLMAGPYDAGTEALQVGVDGEALVITPRFVADDWRLSRPEVQVEGALAQVRRGDTVDVRLVAREDHGFNVQLGDREWIVAFTVGRGWGLFYPTALRSGRVLRTLDLAWLAALALVVGWYALSGTARAAALASLGVAALLAPTWSHLMATPLEQYLALVAGFVAGVLVRRAAGLQRLVGAQTS